MAHVCRYWAIHSFIPGARLDAVQAALNLTSRHRKKQQIGPGLEGDDGEGTGT